MDAKKIIVRFTQVRIDNVTRATFEGRKNTNAPLRFFSVARIITALSFAKSLIHGRWFDFSGPHFCLSAQGFLGPSLFDFRVRFIEFIAQVIWGNHFSLSQFVSTSWKLLWLTAEMRLRMPSQINPAAHLFRSAYLEDYCCRVVPALSLLGCAQYGNNIETTLVKSDTEVLKPNKGNVDLFFEDVHPTHAYKQIGMVESKGNEIGGEQDILDRLKWKAWQEGADAVLNVKKSSQNREAGTLGTDDKRVYTASLYTGVAVKYLDTSYAIDKVDSTLVRDVPERIKAEGEGSASIILPCIILGMVIGVIESENKK